MAPSPLNTQPWEFIVVTGPEMKDQLCSGAETAKAAAFAYACAAAVQNMLLAAHSLAFVCLGKPATLSAKTPRKPLAGKIVFID